MCGKRELEFSVYMIHSMAEYFHKTPSEIYAILNESKILDDYIIPCYDVLHTLGKEYLVEDISGMLEERGVKI